LIWHQHQPSYVDASKDQLIGPWVRTHATKDYFDMAYTVSQFPSVHLTINLTSVLLRQLLDYYVARLGPFVNLQKNTINAQAFLEKWGGQTDPWIDLALKDSRYFNEQDLDYLYNWSGKQLWNCFSISEVIFKRFPEYRALLPDGRQVGSIVGTKDWKTYTARDWRRIKFFFYLANFDPRFLKGPIELPLQDETGRSVVVDLSDLVRYDDGGTPNDDSDDAFYLRREITEEDCQRLVVEAYKVMASVVPIHKRLMFHSDRQRGQGLPPLKPARPGAGPGQGLSPRKGGIPRPKGEGSGQGLPGQGQIELITTPFYHPILPLIYDSDLARICQPADPLPPRFHFPEDAVAQVRKGIFYFRSLFGVPPQGMWPAEGAVAQAVVGIFATAHDDLLWIATGPHVLARSLGKNSPDELSPAELAQAYRVVDTSTGKALAIFFRDWRLSDQIAFEYSSRTPEENVRHLFQALEKYRPQQGLPPGQGKDRILTILMDGENAWEWFRKDNDGVGFLTLLYQRLEEAQREGWLMTVTPTEYILGNPERGIPPHPIEDLPLLENLYPGCWFSPDFSNWIGEAEENKGWSYLLQTRKDLEKSGLKPPAPESPPPPANTPEWYAYQAWEEMYAAEGSDWFWWYGQDETSAGGADILFDRNFILHLENVYRYARLAGVPLTPPQVTKPSFEPIVKQ